MNIPTFCGKAFSAKTTTILLAGLLLGISPMCATAQNMSWDPPATMTFPDTPVGTTAKLTLELTNEDAAVPLTINNLEWTWNQPGEITFAPQFAFVADRPIPTSLFPGESMDIEILFAPETALSIASANLLVTNTSANASPLNVWMDGMGAEGDQCYPRVSCLGTCTDLDNDVNSCGSCGNVCATPTYATAICEIGACGFVCDEGYEPVGDGCQAIVAQTPEELMDALLAFVLESRDTGALLGLGPSGHNQAGEAKLKVFVKNIEKANDYIDYGTPEGMTAACGYLNFSQLRSDGGWPFVMPPDFVAGEAANEVYDRIIELMGVMDGCESTEAPTRPEH